MTDNQKFKDIEKRVKRWVEGKHGRIGIIVPDHKLTEQEWRKHNEELVDLLIENIDKLKDKGT